MKDDAFSKVTESRPRWYATARYRKLYFTALILAVYLDSYRSNYARLKRAWAKDHALLTELSDLAVALKDPMANAYDGASTRAVIVLRLQQWATPEGE